VITKMLVQKINRTQNLHWKWVSKEILSESARELGIPPSEIKYFFSYNEHGMVDGILNTLSNYYITDRKVFNAVRKFIKSIGFAGNIIIVGRGGAAICHDIKNSLHIRLLAPLEWRTEKIMEFYHLDRNKAIEFIKSHDQNRKKFMQHFYQSEDMHDLFDIIYNCASLSKTEIVNSIYSILREKEMLLD
jgi:cytidylate kinase